MQRLHVDRWCGSLGLRFGPEHAGGPVKKLAAPLRDLVGVHVELLRQIGQRLLALDRRQSDLRLESRAVVPAISLFGFNSGAALATVVGVLIEVPVMLSVVWIVNRTKDWYE
jgi:hypothetical protein